jgi:hypothetical protein
MKRIIYNYISGQRKKHVGKKREAKRMVEVSREGRWEDRG